MKTLTGKIRRSTDRPSSLNGPPPGVSDFLRQSLSVSLVILGNPARVGTPYLRVDVVVTLGLDPELY